MKKTLGLDLGTNSLGWAILDDITGSITDKGVLVFPEGIDAANDTLETPAAIRRAKRMGRRMKFRRKTRKWVLLKILIDNSMCPMTHKELNEWKQNGTYPVSNRQFINWLKSSDTTNPYADRAAAANGKVKPYVLGRSLYHISQRRGFKSSRKDAAGGEADASKTGAVKSDISALSKEIADSGCKTLGQYFAQIIENEKDKTAKTRIRNRYTGRIEHYVSEFDSIMVAQGIAQESDLYKALQKAIFDQRPLRSQKHLVGNCPLEPKSPRAQIGHPDFEEYRMRAFVNNLSFENENGEHVPLSMNDRELACSAFMKASPTIKFGDIAKLFKKKFKNEGLRFHYYSDNETVSSCSTRHKMIKAFGAIEFNEQKVFDALTFFDDDDKLHDWFAAHYPMLEEENISALCKIHPREGNAQYSLKAIRKILPFLRKGHDLFTARFLAKLPDIIPDFHDHEDEIIIHLKELQFKCAQNRERMKTEKFRQTEKPLRLLDLFREYFLNEWNVDNDAWNRLYLRSDSPYQIDPKKPGRLPAVNLGMIRNPLVQRSMTTLRRLVNYLRDHGKIDDDTTIRIELARGVNDFATRHAIQIWQKDRAALREKARAELGEGATEQTVDKYILWEEQGRKCLYTSRSISLSEILTGNLFDVEHTVPRSMSGDDSLANKTICEARYNKDVKKGCVPKDCPNYDDEIYTNLAPWRKKVAELDKTYKSQKSKAKSITDPQTKSNARIKAIRTKLELDYWKDKLRRFEITADKLIDPVDGLSGFKRRQLVDTGIMSSHAVEFLRSVYPKVYSVNGTATAFARKAWGIQSDDTKDRTEHTHHAKDAMVIAALTPSRFNAICTSLKDDGKMPSVRPCDICPPPYDNFAETVRDATSDILVKHVLRRTTQKQSSKRNALAKSHPLKSDPSKTVKHVLSRGDTVRGALHKETFYGCITTPDDGEKVFVVRKPLIGPIAAAEAIAPKIVDAAIREIVTAAIETLKANGVKNIEPGMIKMPSGVPINKVRIYANTTNPSKLRNHDFVSEKDYKTPYYVTSAEGSNFRLGVFSVDGRRFVKPDNALDWAQNHKKDDYTPLDQQEGFIGYIYPGSMAITIDTTTREAPETIDRKTQVKRLYKVVKFESTGRITFRHHVEARASTVLKKDLVTSGKYGHGESKINFCYPNELLYLSPGIYLNQMLFEGIHFRMAIDGTITML